MIMEERQIREERSGSQNPNISNGKINESIEQHSTLKIDNLCADQNFQHSMIPVSMRISNELRGMQLRRNGTEITRGLTLVHFLKARLWMCSLDFHLKMRWNWMN